MFISRCIRQKIMPNCCPFCPCGVDVDWKMRQRMVPPKYTTRWTDLSNVF
ncbi:DUF4113 domain-containing protein [Kiloniella litopenaei]